MLALCIISIILSAIGICIGIFLILIITDKVRITPKKPDKFEDYRNDNGLLGSKRMK
jgi:hypothetical protein